MKVLSKNCAKCNIDQDVGEFYKKSKGYLGVDSQCKQCVLNSKKKNYQKELRARRGKIDLLESDQNSMPDHSVYLFQKMVGFT